MTGLRVAAAVLAAGVSGCTASSGDFAPPPSVTGQIAPTAIAPGAAIDVAYAVQAARPISSVMLVGLPQNSLGSGTNPALAAPANGQLIHHAVTIHPPAAAGVYPLQLRVAYTDGTSSTTPIGTLTIADVPGVIEGAAIEPAGHALAACTTPATVASLRYTVFDPNGAADVVNPLLSVPAFPSTVTYYQTVPTLPAASTVTTVTPSGTIVTQPVAPAAPVVAQTVPVALAPTQPVTAPLAPPNAANATRQTVVTPVSIACHIPAGIWTWQVQASDVDQISGQTRLIGPAPVIYSAR
jgi:hypothetical protein